MLLRALDTKKLGTTIGTKSLRELIDIKLLKILSDYFDRVDCKMELEEYLSVLASSEIISRYSLNKKLSINLSPEFVKKFTISNRLVEETISPELELYCKDMKNKKHPPFQRGSINLGLNSTIRNKFKMLKEELCELNIATTYPEIE